MKKAVAIGMALLLWAVNGACAPAGRIRPAVWAGKFYPADRRVLETTIAGLLEQARRGAVRLPAHRPLKALIMPHAGYIYSGLTAAHALLAVDRGQFRRVVLIGPDHRVGLEGCAVSDVTAYQTPLGLVPLDKNARLLRQRFALFKAVPASDAAEHSLEVELPLLQYRLKSFTLVPVVMGRADAGEVSRALDTILDARTLLVVSSDLSHFLPYDAAVARDRHTIRNILNLDAEKIASCRNCACGRGPIAVVIRLARRHHWRPYLLNYTNSGDTAGDKSRVVGYTAIAFLGEEKMSDPTQTRLTEEQGQTLVKLARLTLMQQLGVKVPHGEAPSLEPKLKDPVLQRHSGTFVTLKIDGRLRGCIGSLSAAASIVDGVRHNAVNAALRDPRFAPLSAGELADVDIEVSVLTPPRPLAFHGPDDLISKLHAGKDGVIIRKGPASATFLPQVWQQLPRAQDFLSQLCLKAGLPAGAWKDSGLEVMTYRVQYFEEKR